MAAHRGLNKGKGLEALFPAKNLQNTASPSENQNADTKDRQKAEEKKEARTSPGTSASGKRAEGSKKTAGSSQADSTAAKKSGSPAAGAKGVEPAGTGIPGSRLLKITQIVPNSDQPRKKFAEESIDELAESMKEYGVLQPLLVQKKGKYYEIIAGERRWRAAKKAGIKELPVVIRDFSDQETMEISLIENIQRENLNPIEEAEAYKKLIDDFNMTQEEAAKRVGKSRAAVANSLRLLKLTEPVRDMVIQEELTMGHARAILALDDTGEQLEAAQRVVQDKLSVRDTEKLVKSMLHPRRNLKKPVLDEQTQAVYHELEDRMCRATGTRVEIHAGRNNKGKIEIEYYSQEDLERIIDLIG